MNWNVSAGTEVQPSSSEIKRSAHIWGVSQRMPKETRQSKPRRQALRHHVKTLQVVQFKPNDIKLGRLQEPNKWSRSRNEHLYNSPNIRVNVV